MTRSTPAWLSRATATTTIRVLCVGWAWAAAPAHAFDYPTSERVVWVQTCMQDHPGHYFEMVNKCSCAIDQIAARVRHDDFTTMSTSANARTIGGERGGSLRASDSIQQASRLFAKIQKEAKAACFIQSAPNPSTSALSAPAAASTPASGPASP